MIFNRRTRRLYYEDFLLYKAPARVVRIEDDSIELDATVAYPEGGGQEADHGTIVLDDGTVLRFDDAKKLYLHPAGLAEFPGLQVGGVIKHVIVPEDRLLLRQASLGAPVVVQIDVERRARLALSHTASHLLYLGISQVRPEAIESTIGCHIRPHGARFDFAVENRFEADELARIELVANAYVQSNALVSVSAHAAEPDARLWHCDGRVIPCGGIHLTSAASIGPLQVRRRGLGRGKERISCEFPQAMPALDGYHAKRAEVAS
ncbi:alanyl-tRNA editing protein [Verminephrobacter aporrectodeae subsp. tuberculatae]|nr:alanyl-tRNA editing protein [Verminephrobacter aporrectodeae]MCW5254950.1 alanyl-tRNA editing protein [Verminephrobacter aporrectodeae subsp. tuberculatae]MCW8166751.1 alanyl-tRNA editing protein [Verminephrobacter aporrectodeae subsp. tuberculatae]MCW8170972.1 alanyl-tRNA editing protein [Verminephrobacter aporrectodeae subsp. tuberculatae]MCW8176492.1 alanyl-tRNA editing protein [Verminephrobacter aporrectodeae subsp. tuberculatae]MCW8204212.1 alanyl-tRNA editing protein [Verminephrobacte